MRGSLGRSRCASRLRSRRRPSLAAAHAQADYGRSLTVTAEPAKVGLGDSVTLRFRLTSTSATC